MSYVSVTDCNGQQSILQHAVDYHARGLCVIPVQPQSKVAAIKWTRYQQKRPTASEVYSWFSSHPEWRIAVVFGQVSGNLGCRDFDAENTYLAWREAQPDLAAKLPTAKTSRGYHVYFRSSREEVAKLREQAGGTGNGALVVDDGELRLDSGCYCILPPSRLSNSQKYEWIRPFPASVLDVPEIPIFDAKLFASNFFPTLHIHTDTHAVYLDRLGAAPVATVSLVSCCRVFSHHPERLAATVSDIIETTVPTAVGHRDKKIFEFVRHLKGIPEIRERSARELISILGHWYARCGDVMTAGYGDSQMDFDEACGRFVRSWANARFHNGVDVISDIWRRVRELPIPRCAGQFHSTKTGYLISLCRELQSVAGKGKSFYLDCRTAARLIGETHTASNSRMNYLVECGVLQIVKRHDRLKKKAREYRYLGD